MHLKMRALLRAKHTLDSSCMNFLGQLCQQILFQACTHGLSRLPLQSEPSPHKDCPVLLSDAIPRGNFMM